MTSHRDAITGQFVTAEHAAENPDTTVSEQRTRRPASDYSDLRARAEACPPEDDFNAIWYSEDRLEFAIGTRDRPFVAACSPAVVLGLLDELDRLRGVVRGIRAYCDAFVEESEDPDPEPWNPAAYVLSILDGADVTPADGQPIVRTVGDLTARHIGRRVRLDEYYDAKLETIFAHDGGEVSLNFTHPEGFAFGCRRPLDTPCEVLP